MRLLFVYIFLSLLLTRFDAIFFARWPQLPQCGFVIFYCFACRKHAFCMYSRVHQCVFFFSSKREYIGNMCFRSHFNHTHCVIGVIQFCLEFLKKILFFFILTFLSQIVRSIDRKFFDIIEKFSILLKIYETYWTKYDFSYQFLFCVEMMNEHVILKCWCCCFFLCGFPLNSYLERLTFFCVCLALFFCCYWCYCVLLMIFRCANIGCWTYIAYSAKWLCET